MLDANIVAVALPSIARDLRGEFTDVEWVVSAYILPFAALLIATGALADRLGRRRMLLWGLSIFTIASLLCGLAPTLGALNGARALQAVGAALQLSAALAVISHGFETHERARAYAVWGTVMGVAPTMGPLIGGLISTYFGWRWAFLVNIPIGALLISVATTSIDGARDPEAGRLDFAGIALFGGGLSSVVWALIEANNAGWGSGSTLCKLAGGSVALGLFVVAERMQRWPMVDLSIFRDRTVVGAAVAMFGYAATAQVMMTILPLYLQDAFGQSPAVAGLAMMPFALPLLVCPTIGGKLSGRISGRALLTLGLAVVALGNALTAGAVVAGLGYWAGAIGMFVTGSGAGLLNSESTKVQISAVPPARAGMASGIAATSRFVGIAVGLAVLGAILAAVAEADLRRLGTTVLPGQPLDWHVLGLRIVGGDVADVRPPRTASPRQRCSTPSSVVSSGAIFFSGCRSTPGMVPAISQLDWLSSMTATKVVSGSKQTRDRLKSFGWGIGHSIGVDPQPYRTEATPCLKPSQRLAPLMWACRGF
jgi:EmrB/QacA subfamily drug resistance transporter